MQSAGARVLREDDQDMSREAVLLQWERKIEAAERLPSGSDLLDQGQGRTDEGQVGTVEDQGGTVEELRPTEDATRSEPRRFERSAPASPAAVAAPTDERRTITVTGRPTPARRRPSVIDSQMAQPDRIALWAFLLGLFLVAVAAGTAHA
jgi:hypothetical protein